MKRTNKLVVILALIFTLTLVMFIGASAVTSTTKADSLFEMKLLLGTEKGLELDRVPTRAEAAVMLVRLLGKEAEVKVGNYTHTFTDVPAWADKYVGYLYENGLTKGTSNETFSPEETCNSLMYATFVLRSLGYKESAGDFTYAQALDFSQEIGLISQSTATSDTFIRNDMAGISYSALFQKIGSSDKVLLETLVSDGAVSQASAEKYLKAFEAYKNLATATAPTSDTSYEAQQTANIDFTVKDLPYKISQNSLISAVINGDNVTAKIESTVDFMGKASSFTSYYSDGWLYTETETGKYKAEIPLASVKELRNNDASIHPFYLVDKITCLTSETGTIYTIEYAPEALNGLFDTLLSDSGLGGGNFTSVKQIISFGADGKLKSETISANMAADINENGETQHVTMAISVSSTIVKTGDTVTVTLPTDLNAYTSAS